MDIAKYLLAMVLLLSSNAFADSSCIECMKHKANNIEGLPTNGEIDELAKTTNKLTSKVDSKESYQKGYCNNFDSAEDSVDVESIFEDIDASPYANLMVEFWTAPACRSHVKQDVKIPMIFNTANRAAQGEDFPKTVREYLLEVKKDTSTWLKIINAKTTDGLTFLDYMQFNITNGSYSTKTTQEAAKRIVLYLCNNGGVYSKYKDTVKCQ